MSYRVTIVPAAMEDIVRNAKWWAENRSSEQAIRWYDHALSSIESLATSAARHAASRENDDFPYEIRDLLFGLGSKPSYRAVFTIRENVVYVLTVQRSTQDAIRPEDVGIEEGK